MPTYPIRIPELAGVIINATCEQLDIKSKTNVLEILVKAGAKAKGIKYKEPKN